MEETKLALEIAKGFRGAIQDLITPDLKAMVVLLNQHSATLKEHSSVFKEHGATLKDVSAILKEHSTILKEHSAILKEHGQTLKELNASVSKLEANQERDYQLLKTIDSRLWDLTNQVADIHKRTTP